MLRQFGEDLVRHVAVHHRFGQRQRRAFGRREPRRFAPEEEVLDLLRRHALLPRPAPVLVPFVGGALELGAAQDHQLAQRARRRAVAPQRVGELDPRRQQLRVVAEHPVQVEELAVQLDDALLVLLVDFLQRKTRLLLFACAAIELQSELHARFAGHRAVAGYPNRSTDSTARLQPIAQHLLLHLAGRRSSAAARR